MTLPAMAICARGSNSPAVVLILRTIDSANDSTAISWQDIEMNDKAVSGRALCVDCNSNALSRHAKASATGC